MKVAITGATGFIGKHLVLKHLELGDEVQIMSRKDCGNLDFSHQVKIFNADLLDNKEILDAFVDGVDILYHCAAEIRDESKMFKVNVEGTNNLIRSAKGKAKHWVQLSSTGVYGHLLSGRVTENQKLNPMNMYEKSKVASDKLVIEAGLNHFFSYSILRPSNVFAPDMRNQSLFQLIRAIDKGLFFFIGTKGANANYIPVENVVYALTLLGKDERAKGNIYNLSDSLTIESFISLIAKTLNRSTPKMRMPLFLMKGLGLLGNIIPGSPLTLGRVDALSTRVKYENNLIEKELNYNPVISIEKGIENLVANYKNRFQ